MDHKKHRLSGGVFISPPTVNSKLNRQGHLVLGMGLIYTQADSAKVD